MSVGSMQPRLEAVRQLLDLFRLERMVYLGTTLLALAILIVSAVILLVKDQLNSPLIATGLFGSSGLITFTTGRLLRMWNQAFRAILGEEEEEKRDAGK
jgi:hypothetical protein